MGLFDSLYDTSNQGGLIDRLLSQLGQGQQLAFSGLPSDQAQYGQPQMAPQFAPAMPQNAQPSPIGSLSQANAQMQHYPYAMPQQGASEPPQVQQQQPQPIQQQPSLPAAFLQPEGGGVGGFMRGAAANHGAGLVGMALGGIAGAAGMGEGDRHNAQLNAQYRALIDAGVPQQKALLATINQEYAKTIIPAELGSDKFAFTTLPDGTVVRENARTGEVAPSYQGSAKPTFGIVREDDGKKVYGWQDPTKRAITEYQPPSSSEDRGTVTGPDGKPIQIPEGVDRKTFVNEISRANAKAAAGEKTEVQAKAEIFANKMESAEAVLGKLQGQGQSYLGRVSEGSDYIPGSNTAGRYLQSDNYQKYKQAASNFITALLRQESGAAINKSEFERYDREYMPQPGDGAEVLKQKKEARRVAIEGMKKGAGPGYKSPTAASGEAADPLGIR